MKVSPAFPFIFCFSFSSYSSEPYTADASGRVNAMPRTVIRSVVDNCPETEGTMKGDSEDLHKHLVPTMNIFVTCPLRMACTRFRAQRRPVGWCEVKASLGT